MTDLCGHPYHAFLHRVLSPSRYVGGEWGTVAKAPDPARTRLALVFPDVYEVGMSHLGSQILYGEVNRHDDLAAERAFAPWGDLEAELRARGLPLVTLETWTPLRDFDVVGFSLQHELSFTNVLSCLDLGGVPLAAADRSDRDPIVLGGGPGAMHPEPVAPFFDAFFAGEADVALADLLRLVGRMRRAGATRGDVLAALAACPGVYVPSLYVARPDARTGWLIPRPAAPGVPARVARQFLADLDQVPIPATTYVPWNRAVFDRASIEIARGCSEGCRFCEAGFTYRPLRDRSPAAVVRDTLAAVRAAGHEEVSLGSLSPADHPGLAPLVHRLSKELTPAGVTLTISSLRAYGLPDQVLRDLKAVRATGLTLAPEAGSQRLRDVINKNIREDDILEAARRAFGGGWQRMKLYFMLGLPTETADDVRAIVALSRAVLRAGRALGRATVTASIGVFVPRPHTPFQWEPMASAADIAERQGLLRDEAKRAGVTVKLPDLRVSRMEGVFARGDRRLADVILRAYRKGCRFDNWSDVVRHDLWDEAFREAGIDPGEYLAAIPDDAALPWEIIDPLVSTDFLKAEASRARRAMAIVPCEKPAPRAGVRPGPEAFLAAGRVVCWRCGAGCDPSALAEVRAATVREAAGLDEGAEPPTAVPPVVEPPATEPPALQPGEPSPAEAAPESPGTIESPTHDSRLTAHDSPVLWHLRYARLGRAAWLSQRDVVKHVPRVLRRAGLRFAMSGGYHPMPKIAYADPIPVGYRTVGEWADAALLLPPDGVPDLDALNAASVDGLRFLEARPAQGRRGVWGAVRYAFLSPATAEEVAPAVAPAQVAPGDAAGLRDLLLASPHGDRDGTAVHSCVLTWPVPGHPPGRPHEVLTAALGVEVVPSDLVRLYDDPREAPRPAPPDPALESGVDPEPEPEAEPPQEVA